jgi:hypothetical protein
MTARRNWTSCFKLARSCFDSAVKAVHQYATGMTHVFVNGKQVLKDGEHTGAKPGRVVRGPGWKGWKKNNAKPAAPKS